MRLEDLIVEYGRQTVTTIDLQRFQCGGCGEGVWVVPLHAGPHFCRLACAIQWSTTFATTHKELGP